MDPQPGPSYLMRKDLPQARLSLIEHEEEPSQEESLVSTHVKEEKVEPKTGFTLSDLIIPGHQPPAIPPPSSLSDEPFNIFTAIWNTVVYILLTLLFFIVFPVALLILFLPAVFIRILVKGILKCFYGCRVQMLPISRVFGSVQGNYNTVVLVCRGRCDIERIRDHMVAIIGAINPTNGVARFAHLQQRVASYLGYLCLEGYNARFDIKNHVKHFDIRSKNLTVDSNDVINYLESTYNDPFENSMTQPQWEILVIPKYSHRSQDMKLMPESEQQRRLYALIFRFHHGIMDWNMFQTLLVEFIGKTSGRVKSIFCPTTEKHNCCMKICKELQNFFSILVAGPYDFMLKVFTRWTRFGGMKKMHAEKTSLAMTKPIDCETIEDIKNNTYTTTDTILTSCVRVGMRNMVLGHGKKIPKQMKAIRIFNSCSASLPGIHGYNANYRKWRNTQERLHGSFHASGKNQIYKDGIKLFNKGMILFGGVFVESIAAWIFRNLLKSDVVVEIWPCSDEPCKVFGGDIIADVFGWSGASGINADFKITITSYCGRARANVIGKLGGLSGEYNDAETIAREFVEEYQMVAALAHVYPNRLFLAPAVDESHAMYL